MKMKKKIGHSAVIVLILCGVFAAWYFGKQEKKQEVIWYISDPGFYGVERDCIEPYQEMKSERFDLFNDRLEELGIAAKVIFKYMPGKIEDDLDGDIAEFSSLEYDNFLILDEYLEKQENIKVLDALPKGIWKVNRINGKTYQIPRGSVPIRETVYNFYTPFLEKYQITLSEEEIKQMNPKEVIEFLLPYFEEERFLDGQYYLTSVYDLNYMWYYQENYHSVIPFSSDSNLSVDLKQGKIVDLMDTEAFRKALEVGTWIYREDIDAHTMLESMNGHAVFQIGNVPIIEELSGKQESSWTTILLGNRYMASSRGNGVLKSSTVKELAVQVLAASMYDEELTNLMIYGIEGKDYQLEDGHAVYLSDKAIISMGSFSQIGNNLIAYPNELEVKEKREITERLVEQTQVLPYNNFVPLLDEELYENLLKISDIYREIERTVAFDEIPDLEQYINEQKQKLEETGTEEAILSLQEQLDGWKE